jgi:hypothetical protein
MEAIDIRRGTTGVELVIPVFAKDITIDLLGNTVEEMTPLDITGYTVEFTFRKVDPQGLLVATVCKVGSVTARSVMVNGNPVTMQVATYTADNTVFDTLGKTFVTVTITLGAVVRTPNEELVFKILPNEHC